MTDKNEAMAANGRLGGRPKTITDRQLKNIRADNTSTDMALAKKYGVTHFHINRLRNNKLRV